MSRFMNTSQPVKVKVDFLTSTLSSYSFNTADLLSLMKMNKQRGFAHYWRWWISLTVLLITKSEEMSHVSGECCYHNTAMLHFPVIAKCSLKDGIIVKVCDNTWRQLTARILWLFTVYAEGCILHFQSQDHKVNVMIQFYVILCSHAVSLAEGNTSIATVCFCFVSTVCIIL